MATYGKKKRSIMPTLTNIKDSISSPLRKKKNIEQSSSRQALLSSIGNSTLIKVNGKDARASTTNDGIDEIASMLLEDSDIEDQPVPRRNKVVSRLTASNTASSLTSNTSNHNKPLPAPPDDDSGDESMSVEEDNARRGRMLSKNNLKDPLVDDQQTLLPGDRPVQRKQQHRASLPPVPRRSSKRAPQPQQTSDRPAAARGSREDMNIGKLIKNTSAQSLLSIEDWKQMGYGRREPEAMKVVRPKTGKFIEHNLDDVPTAKPMEQRGKNGKVMGRVRNAINDRLTRYRRDSLQKHQLSSDEGMYDDHGSDNGHDRESEFEPDSKPVKRRKQTGASKIHPAKQASKSSKNSTTNQHAVAHWDDFFGLRYEKQHRCEVEQNRGMVGSTGPEPVEEYASPDVDVEMQYASVTDHSETPSLQQTPPKRLRHTKKTSNLNFEADFDACFSSSPFDSSTPRLRLEPVDDHGKKTLRSVSASSPSMFDSAAIDTDMEDVENLAVTSYLPFHDKIKKHPSPSKMELEELQQAMGRLSDFQISTDGAEMQAAASEKAAKQAIPRVLSQIDANVGGRPRDMLQNKNNCPATHKSAIPRPAAPSKRLPASAKGRFPVKPSKSAISTKAKNIESTSDAMEVDELQWEDSAYNIGRKHT